MANIGISCHGVMRTIVNPSLAIRRRFPEIDWQSFPKSPDEGGPAMARSFYRLWSDSSKQDAFDTSATVFTGDEEFLRGCPWLDPKLGDLGEQSDGASNYLCTSSMIYSLLNPHQQFQIFSIAGEGKDQVDRDNGSEQSKLKAHVAAGNDLTHARQFIGACNARRHAGSINLRIEIDRRLAITPADKKHVKPITGIGDLKVRDVSGTITDGVRAWEFFDRPGSTAAGRPVGFGKGRHISLDLLTAKHGLALHRLPSGSAEMTFPETDVLADGENPHVNFTGLRSREEKSAAKIVDRETKEKKADDREARGAATVALAASLCAAARTKCPRGCGAMFRSVARLSKHEKSGCGRFAQRIARRVEHSARSIRGRLAAHDDDLAEEAERIEEEGLDLVTIEIPPSASVYDWTVSAALDEDDGAPTSHTGLKWITPNVSTRVSTGDLVRVSTKYHADVARAVFGLFWEDKFFYGKIHRRSLKSTVTYDIEYIDDETHEYGPDGTNDVLPSHFTHFEIGVEVDVAVVGSRTAVVTRVVLGGVASRQLVPVGSSIVSVDGIATPRFDEARTALCAATTRRAKPVPVVDGVLPPRRCTIVILRRPVPQSAARGWARPCCFRSSPFIWRDDVVKSFDEIIKQPAFQRRGQAVYEELKKYYGYALDDDGKCVLPSMKDVENRMLNAWKRAQKSKRDAAQDSAARALARKARDAGVADDETDTGIIDSDDNDSNDGDGDHPMTEGSTPQTAFQLHFVNLAGIKVGDLRERLHAKHHSKIVYAADLPAGTPPSGTQKSAAVLNILRERLARVLADEEI
jgi:hypothetical protein